MGWTKLSNGALLRAAETNFDVLITTDRNLRYQQNVAGFRLAVLVLPTTSWLQIRNHLEMVGIAVDKLRAGEVVELNFS